MVVDLRARQQQREAKTDRLLAALADPTRRDIVATSVYGEHSVSALARRYPMSIAAVQKHVAILERAGLVTKERRGRETLVRADLAAVRRASSALHALEALWRARLDQFEAVLADVRPSSIAQPSPTTPTSRGARS